jgi:hypothetical protein
MFFIPFESIGQKRKQCERSACRKGTASIFVTVIRAEIPDKTTLLFCKDKNVYH